MMEYQVNKKYRVAVRSRRNKEVEEFDGAYVEGFSWTAVGVTEPHRGHAFHYVDDDGVNRLLHVSTIDIVSVEPLE